MEKIFKIFMVEDDKNFGAVLKSYLPVLCKLKTTNF
jgi:hypothetical protein